MDRRFFLRCMSLSTVWLANFPRLVVEAKALHTETARVYKHWAWARFDREASSAELMRQFAQMRAAGIQAVLLGGGDRRIYAHAREQGLEVHAWLWALCRNDQDLADNHPEWHAVSRTGDSTLAKPPYVDYYRFLCPSRDAVQEYLAGIVADLAGNEELAGVHLDYIRYPDIILPSGLWEKYGLVQDEELPPFDFCYCEVCRQKFQEVEGVDPLALSDPAAHAAWRQYRCDSVTRLVNRLADIVHRSAKQITAAVFPTPAIARKLVRQDWPSWNLDAVMPMIYHNFYEQNVGWIQQAVGEGVAALPPDRPLYAGLYLPALQDEEEYEQAVAGALVEGASGVSLFGGVRDIPRR